MPGEDYEFSDAQNEVMLDLARKMQGVGIFMLVLGTLALIGFVVSLFAEPQGVWIFVAAFFLVIGVWTVRAAREFRQVVTTEGSDISHLMTALTELKKFYTLNFWLFVVYLVLMLLTILGIPKGLG